MKRLLLILLLLGSSTLTMHIQQVKTALPDGEDYEELPQELLDLWKRYHELKRYHAHVFGVLIDESDWRLVQLRLKSLKMETRMLAKTIAKKAMEEDQRAYVMSHIKKLQQKIHYFPL